MEEGSTDELDSGGRGTAPNPKEKEGTNTFPKEKEEDAPADENSELLGEGVVRSWRRMQSSSQACNTKCYTELVEEQALGTSASKEEIGKSENS